MHCQVCDPFICDARLSLQSGGFLFSARWRAETELKTVSERKRLEGIFSGIFTQMKIASLMGRWREETELKTVSERKRLEGIFSGIFTQMKIASLMGRWREETELK